MDNDYVSANGSSRKVTPSVCNTAALLTMRGGVDLSTQTIIAWAHPRCFRASAPGRSLSVVTAASGDQVECKRLVSTDALRITSVLAHEEGADGRWMMSITAVVA